MHTNKHKTYPKVTKLWTVLSKLTTSTTTRSKNKKFLKMYGIHLRPTTNIVWIHLIHFSTSAAVNGHLSVPSTNTQLKWLGRRTATNHKELRECKLPPRHKLELCLKLYFMRKLLLEAQCRSDWQIWLSYDNWNIFLMHRCSTVNICAKFHENQDAYSTRTHNKCGVTYSEHYFTITTDAPPQVHYWFNTHGHWSIPGSWLSQDPHHKHSMQRTNSPQN